VEVEAPAPALVAETLLVTVREPAGAAGAEDHVAAVDGAAAAAASVEDADRADRGVAL
jgi:hypothetical protein